MPASTADRFAPESTFFSPHAPLSEILGACLRIHSRTPLDLSRGLAVVLSVIIAGLVFFLARRLPLQDPIDIIGPPLWTGEYSERAEQIAFYLLIACSAGLAPLLGKGLSRWRPRLSLWWGDLTLTGLTGWQAFHHPTFVMAILGLAGLGRLLNRRRIGNRHAALLWLVPACAWEAITFVKPLQHIDPSTSFVAFVTVVTAVVYYVKERRPAILNRFWGPFWGSLALGAFLIAWGTSFSFGLACSLGAGAFLAGAYLGKFRACREELPLLPWWLTLFAFIAWACSGHWVITHAWLHYMASGAIAGFWLLLGLQRAEFSLQSEASDRNNGSVLLDWSPVIFGLLAIVCLRRLPGWYALVMCPLLIGLFVQSDQLRRWRFRWGLLLAALLALMTIPPVVVPGDVDVFHDGQRMSAAWEFLSGRKLYSEVFPLSGADFFATCALWKVFPPTLESSSLILLFPQPMVVAGACLITYCWTRSATWALACGLMVAPQGSYLLTPRDGLSALLIGLCMGALASPHPRTWLWVIPWGILSQFGGYDVMVGVIPPAAAALFLAASPVAIRNRTAREWGFCCAWAGAILVGSLGGFALIIIAWQGVDSLVAYWTLFFDLAHSLNALFGLPMRFLNREFRDLEYLLLTQALFAAICGLNWKQISARRKRMGAFLLLAGVMCFHRTLGRSDLQHILFLRWLEIVLWYLIGLHVLRGVLRLRQGPLIIRPQTVGLILAALSVWQGRNGSIPPWKLARQLQAVPQVNQHFSMQPIAEIAERLPPESYLWPVEYGIGNFIYQRFNPTRHALAYCIGSPTEQRRAVLDLRSHSTPVILWDWQIIDGISGLLRHYVISTDVLRRYRPEFSNQKFPFGEYAVPAEPDWPGLETVPALLSETQAQGLVPMTWGRLRWPQLQSQVTARQNLTDWKPPQPDHRTGWIVQGALNPREFNYLKVRIASQQVGPTGKELMKIFVRFNDREQDHLTFEIPRDGLPHECLVPVGCVPAWTWRKQITEVFITGENLSIEMPVGEVLEINEVHAGPTGFPRITE